MAASRNRGSRTAGLQYVEGASSGLCSKYVLEGVCGGGLVGMELLSFCCGQRVIIHEDRYMIVQRINVG